MNKKIVIPVIALIMVLAGGVFAWQYFGVSPKRVEVPKEEMKAPEEMVKDETANWRTYRNEEFGFEVRYPGGLDY